MSEKERIIQSEISSSQAGNINNIESESLNISKNINESKPPESIPPSSESTSPPPSKPKYLTPSYIITSIILFILLSFYLYFFVYHPEAFQYYKNKYFPNSQKKPEKIPPPPQKNTQEFSKTTQPHVNSHSFPSFIPKNEDLHFTEKSHRELSRKMAPEGMVLARNPGEILPIRSDDKVVLFGKASKKTVYGGRGSTVVYIKGTRKEVTGVSLVEGVENKYKEKKCLYEKNNKEFLLTDEGEKLTEEDIEKFSDKKIIKAKRSIAVLTISRMSSESYDRNITDFKFKEKEISTYKVLRKYFDKIVLVLNVPGMLDIPEIIYNDNNTSILISFYPGIEAGNAIADVLFGDAYPSGHLSDTWAKSIYDYPTTLTFLENDFYVKYKEGIFVGYRFFEDNENNWKKVLFPFGYGLTYTQFEIKNKCTYDKEKKIFIVTSVVKNIGKNKGKQVIQVYVEKPQNEKFIKAKRELVGFDKTKEIEPGKSQELKIEIKLENFASYDDSGVTGAGNKNCYVLEKGDYNIYVGTNVAETRDISSKVYTHKIDKLIVTQKLSAKLTPKDPEVADANTKPDFDKLFIKKDNNNGKQLRQLNSEKEETEKKYKVNKINFKTVLEKKYSMIKLIKSMSNEELAFLSFGHGIGNTYVTGVIGSYYKNPIKSKYLIPFSETMDSPAGVRQPKIEMQSVAWPCATLLASSFNLPLLTKYGEEIAKEARKVNGTIWLAPAMNLHRSPLCGRNFEYYSEDPFLAGKMAASAIKGVQEKRVAATVKHFFANNKERNRLPRKGKKASDSRMAERVAREIYLKSFEIAIKEGKPWCVMTSYNRVNGVQTMERKDLLTGILREEWGFEGLVMTDWLGTWNLVKEIQAGGNVKMPGNKKDLLPVLKGLKEKKINRKMLEKNALYVLNTIAKTATIDRLF